MGAFISNPLAAYGQDADATPHAQAVVKEYRAGSTLAIGQIVKLTKGTATVGGNTVDVLNVDAATALTDTAIGIVVKGGNEGESVQVCTQGPCKVQATTSSVADSTWFGATTGGRVVAVATGGTFGTKAVGITLEATGTTAGALKFVYVNPTLIAAS